MPSLLPTEPAQAFTPSLWRLGQPVSLRQGHDPTRHQWLLVVADHGRYPTWIDSIKNFDLLPLTIMAFAALAGAALTLYLLANMFKHHAKSVLSGLFGLMIASLATLFPYLSRSNEHDAVLMGWMIGAALISYMLTHMGRRQKTV